MSLKTIAVVVCLCIGGQLAAADPDPTPVPGDGSAVTADPTSPAAPEPKTVPDPPIATRPAKPIPDTRGPWYRGPYARNRFIHMGVTAALGGYLLSGSVFNFSLTAHACRWCTPPSFDRAARTALVWSNTKRADSLSSLDAYVLGPIVGLSLLIASDYDAGTSRLIDDILPVVETVAIVQVLTQFGKYGFARSRPYVYFATSTLDPGADNYSSFWSGHSVLGFAITSAAATVCHFRHYWTEPYVWATGIALSVSAEYLRIAADKHYLSDVVGGGVVGIAAGLLVPRLMQRSITIVPVANGAAVVGMF